MAFYRGGPTSPRDDQYSPNTMSSPQRNPNRWSASMLGTNDVRGALHRRFTTNTVPTLSPIGQQRRQAAGEVQQPLNGQNRMTPSERAARHYENLLQAQRKIQEELEKVDAETRREVDENLRHEQSVTQLFAQSEPATPPEYNTGFSNNFSQPHRYSTASLTSPLGIATRPNRSSTHLTSPPVGIAHIYTNGPNPNLPSHSVPGSRRQSDDEEDGADFIYSYDNSIRRAAANPNRNSMPITSYDRSKRNTTDLVFGPFNTTGFLFDDDDKQMSKSNKTSPPDTKTYLQVQHTADGFPKLIRREEHDDLSLSAASAALDLASSHEHSLQQVTDRAVASRHRISLPPSALSGSINMAPMNSILANANDNRPVANNRRSVEVHFTADTKRPTTLLALPPCGVPNGSQGAMSSYSTNDIPTLKSINGDAPEGGVSLASPSSHTIVLSNNTSPEMNAANLSRLSSASNGQGPDFSSMSPTDGLQDAFNQAQSSLQANALPFGPGVQDNQTPGFGSPTMPQFGQPSAYYGGYAMQIMGNGFNAMNIGGSNGYVAQGQWNQFGGPYQQGSASTYQQYQQNGQSGPVAGRFENQRVSVQQRRQAAEDAQAKFNSIKVEQLVGEIYTLCKDQHGCRFLQRKLDERSEKTVQIIFDEIKQHMIDLMVDPFGNYLCQKLLESATDEQRTVLIQHAKPAMTTIALNQHGTRALQKMIEHISTPEQTALIIEALRDDVVVLIQDLNGNHVIQKCLNHLSSADATFIFEAVGLNSLVVGTHRHGCCVLQRCIDHADGLQKGQIVDHVIRNAYALVQDPFGNYVVQYILDLAEPCFTEPLCRAFFGEIPTLSKQKFSSNVIEKCIRCASNETRRVIITEIMAPPVLEKLLHDGFANYVVQTAMDFADDELKPLLVENVRMILPGIRSTPHGRRIHSKISDHDNRTVNPIPTTLSPLETASSPNVASYSGTQQTPAPSRTNRHGMIGVPPQWAASSGFGVGGFDGNNPTIGFSGDNVASLSPQRGNQSFGMFNNGNQNFQSGNGYGGNGFSGPGRPPYGQF